MLVTESADVAKTKAGPSTALRGSTCPSCPRARGWICPKARRQRPDTAPQPVGPPGYQRCRLG
eukprot:3073231-Alexandrium_andersonii.AAC.1